jgi:SAM-dependent methyltransferase
MASSQKRYQCSRFAREMAARGAPAGGRLDVRRRRDAYYGELPRQAMRSMLARIDMAGRDAAAFERAFAAAVDRHLYEYAFDSSRADWIELFLHQPRPLALDYGAGLGNFALRLAERCEEVWAVDATPERLDFIDRRAGVAGRDNVFTLAADHPCQIPLPESSFDLVLVNGVLEWTAIGSGTRPDDYHRAFLEGLVRLLKPGGSLVVAIENRLSLLHFLGMTEHNDFPFAPLLPRDLASFIHRMLRRGPYETWTYTEGSLRKVLRGAGAVPSRLFWALPSYQQARLVIDRREPALGASVKIAHLLPAHTWRWRVLRSALWGLAVTGLLPVFAPAFVIEAVRRES